MKATPRHLASAQIQGSHYRRDDRGAAPVETIFVLVLMTVSGIIGFRLLMGQGAEDPVEQSTTYTQTATEQSGQFNMPWEPIGYGAAGLLALGGVGAGGTATYRVVARRKRDATAVQARIRGRWRTALVKHDAIREEYATICCDPLAALDYMALWDIKDVFTEKFTVAMGTCNDLRSIHEGKSAGTEPTDETAVEQFAQAVETCAARWNTAKTHARQHGLGVLSKTGQQAARQARKLLAVALDESATDAERSLAAQRATTLLNSIKDVAFPEEIRAAIETPAYRQLNQASTAPIEMVSKSVAVNAV